MRIGLISYEYPPQRGLGGVGTYMARLAGALADAGHEVHVIAGPSEAEAEAKQTIHVHRIPARFDPPVSRPLRWIWWRGVARPMSWLHPIVWHWLQWNLASREAIHRIDRQHPFDLVEVPEHAASGWMAGRIHRWPIVLRAHCPWDLFTKINGMPANPMHWLLAHLERHTAARHADCVTAPSHAMRHYLEGKWRLREPIHVIPNFMDVPDRPAPLPEDSGPQPIVCIGRVEPLKGQDTLVRAFALLAPRYPRSELWLIGPDHWPQVRSFAELVDQLAPDPLVRRRIHLPGALPLGDVAGRLSRARVAVIASRGFESFSFATLEAMAAARPVIATRTGALPELVEDGQTGHLVPADNVWSMAAAIERFLSDRAESERCAMQAHARALQHYDTRRVLPQMLDVYAQAAKSFRARHEPAPLRVAQPVS